MSAVILEHVVKRLVLYRVDVLLSDTNQFLEFILFELIFQD